jgi:hypothetical protein
MECAYGRPAARRIADLLQSDAGKLKAMSMKHRRGNREAKKPKQNKPKVVTAVSPFTPPIKAKGAKTK